MPTTTLSDIVASLFPDTTYVIDASGGGDYTEVDTALSTETASGNTFILAPTGPYSPSSVPSLGADQDFIAYGKAEISGTNFEVTGDSTYVAGLRVNNAQLIVSGNAARIHRNEVLGNAVSGNASLYELQTDGNNIYADGNYVEGTIGGSGSGTIGANHTV